MFTRPIPDAQPPGCENPAVRVDRHFAFVDLSGFTSYTDAHGDEESVHVLTEFRGAVRRIATDFGVRIAKWLGDGCMLVAVDASQLVAAVVELERIIDDADLPLAMHAGVAGGAVMLLEGDDYTGGPVNLASRLCDVAVPHEILVTPMIAEVAPPDAIREDVGPLSFPGLSQPVDIVRLRCHEAEPAGGR